MKTIQEVTVYRIFEDGVEQDGCYDCGAAMEFATREEAEEYINPPLRMWCKTKEESDRQAMFYRIANTLRDSFAPRISELAKRDTLRSWDDSSFVTFPARR